MTTLSTPNPTPADTRRGKRFAQLVQEAKGRIQEVSVDTLQQWQAEAKPMVIIDVREPEDYAKGHIPGARLIPRGELELDIDEQVPDQDTCIVLNCGGGSRSALAADTLQQMGYSAVYSLTGGWRAWSQSNP